MYIKSIELNNIRCFDKFRMDFAEPAGWHVIIGDNGSGKTNLLRTIGFGLIGKQSTALRHSPAHWLKYGKENGVAKIILSGDKQYEETMISDSLQNPRPEEKNVDVSRLESNTLLLRTHNAILAEEDVQTGKRTENSLSEGVLAINIINVNGDKYNDWGKKGWFSVGFGPFRRFTDGNSDKEKIFITHPRLGAHLSLFEEDISFTESLKWIIELDYQRLKEQEYDDKEKESETVFQGLLRFINESKLLPNGTSIVGVNKSGLVFRNDNADQINLDELSDGFRSVLSLTFELIRQMVRVYGANLVFQEIQKGNMEIPLPGVVLIDEIDAHLHPSWQAEIGYWFTKYFPKLQFIVTTHSPLVCRACENGTIWRLAKPGSEMQSGEVTGLERERLIFGNILDAYGTDLFGERTVRSANSDQKRARLGKLNMLYALNKISPAEENERLELQKILSTDDPTGF